MIGCQNNPLPFLVFAFSFRNLYMEKAGMYSSKGIQHTRIFLPWKRLRKHPMLLSDNLSSVLSKPSEEEIFSNGAKKFSFRKSLQSSQFVGSPLILPSIFNRLPSSETRSLTLKCNKSFQQKMYSSQTVDPSSLTFKGFPLLLYLVIIVCIKHHCTV